MFSPDLPKPADSTTFHRKPSAFDTWSYCHPEMTIEDKVVSFLDYLYNERGMRGQSLSNNGRELCKLFLLPRSLYLGRYPD